MTTDVLTLIIAQLREDWWPEEAYAIDFNQFERILERFRSDIPIATENAYLALKRFDLNTMLAYHDRSNKTTVATKRELFKKLLASPERLEALAVGALEELEIADDGTEAESIFGSFQAAGLDLIREIERFALATEHTEEAVAQ